MFPCINEILAHAQGASIRAATLFDYRELTLGGKPLGIVLFVAQLPLIFIFTNRLLIPEH